MSVELFAKRLTELMSLEKLSKRALATKADVQRKSILNWLDGKSYPRYDSLVKLANYFDITTDYLLGIDSDCFTEKYHNISIQDVPNIFRTRLKELLILKKMSEYRLAKTLNIGCSAVTKWLHYDRMAETTTLIEIAHIFDCTVDYLLGRAEL